MPVSAKAVDAGTKTNTINRRRRDDQYQHNHDNDAFHNYSPPFLEATTTIKSYPSYSGRRLSIPPPRSTASKASPQCVQKVTVTAGVAAIKPKSVSPTTNSATNASTPPTIPHRQTYFATRPRLSCARLCRVCVAGLCVCRADRAGPGVGKSHGRSAKRVVAIKGNVFERLSHQSKHSHLVTLPARSLLAGRSVIYRAHFLGSG